MKKLLLLGLVAGVCAVALSLRSSDKSRIRDEWTAMGTVAGLTFRGDASDREAVRGLVQARYERLESLLSAWDADSELSRLSREGGTNWIGRVSAEVTECYRAAMLLAERSGGAFKAMPSDCVRTCTSTCSGCLPGKERTARCTAFPSGWNMVRLVGRGENVRSGEQFHVTATSHGIAKMRLPCGSRGICGIMRQHNT